jgi:hypothetical protein
LNNYLNATQANNEHKQQQQDRLPKATTATIRERETKKTTQFTSDAASQSLLATQSDLFGTNQSQTNKQQSIQTFFQNSNEHDDLSKEDIEPLPKTFILVKENYEYFKPKIQLEMDNPDKADTMTEVFIRGWRLEPNVLNCLHMTLPFCEKLVALKYAISFLKLF